MYRFLFALVFLTQGFCCAAESLLEPEHLDFVVAIASYNNEKWVKDNLDSVYNLIIPQNCTLEVYYMDDASDDSTGKQVDKYFKEHNVPKTWHVIHNKTRQKQLANYYNLIHSLDPKKIVLIVDGDDKLATKYTLITLAEVYRTPINGQKIWTTYGNYIRLIPDGVKSICAEIPADIVKNNAFRTLPSFASHLRTFYAGLYQKIHKEHLLYKGQFFPLNTDIATMIPMLEMSSKGHFFFIRKILYVYNNDNPNSCLTQNNSDRLLSPAIKEIIRKTPPYKPLDTLW